MTYCIRLSAACAALALLTAAQAANAAPPSFDCDGYRRHSTEGAICASRYLSRLDRRLSRAYYEVSGQLAPWARRRLRRTQLNWIALRNDCGWRRWCIARSYRQRIYQLRQYDNCFDHTVSPGCISRTLRRHAASQH